MKSSSHPLSYFSPLSVGSVKQDGAVKSAGQSPYLKAVLTAKRSPGSTKVLTMSNSSLAAALRYIKQS